MICVWFPRKWIWFLNGWFALIILKCLFTPTFKLMRLQNEAFWSIVFYCFHVISRNNWDFVLITFKAFSWNWFVYTMKMTSSGILDNRCLNGTHCLRLIFDKIHIVYNNLAYSPNFLTYPKTTKHYKVNIIAYNVHNGIILKLNRWTVTVFSFEWLLFYWVEMRCLFWIFT